MPRNLGGLYPSEIDNYFYSPTFSIRALDETLKEAKYSSYEFLKAHSKSMAGMDRFVFTGAKIRRIYDIGGIEVEPYGEYYGLIVPSTIVKVDSREAFRRSELFNKNLTLHEISRHPEYFSHFFLIRIEDSFYPTVYTRCEDGLTYILFHRSNVANNSLLTKTVDNMYGATNVTIEVLRIPNCEVGEMEISGAALRQAAYKINPLTFPIRSGVVSGNRTGNYMFLINRIGDYNAFNAIKTKTDTVGNPVLDSTYPFRDHGENIAEGDISNGIRIFYLYSPYLLKPRWIDRGKNWFATPMENGPIHTANMLVTYKRNDSNGAFAATAPPAIQPAYPNKYEILNWARDKEKLVFIFDVDSNDRVFKSFLHRYQRRVLKDPEDVTRYEEGSIPSYIKNYVPPEVSFSVSEFVHGEHGLGDKNDFNKYRIDTMNGLITEDGNYLSMYNDFLGIHRPNFLIDVRKRSLAGRTRMNTYPERVYPEMAFSEPHYVFIFGKDLSPNPIHYKFYIDGISFWPKYIWYEADRTVVYFPIDIIGVDTIVEVEKIYDIHSVNIGNTKAINEASVTIKMEYRDEGTIIAKDIRYYDNSDNPLDDSKFGPVYSWEPDEYGTDIEFSKTFPNKKDGYMRISMDQPIAALDSSVTNKTISAVIDKRYGYNLFHVENEDMVGENFEFFSIATSNPLRFRVFKNGQLLSPDKWSLVKDPDPLRPLTLIINIRKYVGDIFTIEELPYLYEMVYKKEGDYLDSTSVGLVNIALERPLDLRWYDIYINGRKINETHIEEMGVRRLIISKKVTSNRNIYVFQKNREPNKDIFKLSTAGPFGIDDRVFDDVEFQNTLPRMLEYDFRENDLFTEPIDPGNFIIRTYYKKHMVFRNINPDYEQIDQYTVDNYRALLDDKNRFLINPDEGESGAYIMPINPDQ